MEPCFVDEFGGRAAEALASDAGDVLVRAACEAHECGHAGLKVLGLGDLSAGLLQPDRGVAPAALFDGPHHGERPHEEEIEGEGIGAL